MENECPDAIGVRPIGVIVHPPWRVTLTAATAPSRSLENCLRRNFCRNGLPLAGLRKRPVSIGSPSTAARTFVTVCQPRVGVPVPCPPDEHKTANLGGLNRYRDLPFHRDNHRRSAGSIGCPRQHPSRSQFVMTVPAVPPWSRSTVEFDALCRERPLILFHPGHRPSPCIVAAGKTDYKLIDACIIIMNGCRENIDPPGHPVRPGSGATSGS